MSQPTYIASCSFGKDSIATILLALEHDEPLDRVVFSEVMFDHARNISGEIPEHIGWIYDTAIPKLHDMGIHVDVVRAERDYCYFFANAVGGGGECRKDLRVPARRQMLHKPGLQSRAHTKIPRRNCWRSPACQNEYRAVHRYRRRRTASTCKTHREQNIALGEIWLHRADGETTLRRSRATVADLHDRDARPIPEHRVEANARLLAAAPDLLAALESLVETFDPDRQVIYSFARGKIEAAKHAIEYIYQSNRQ